MPTTARIQRATFALQMAEFVTRIGARMRRLREERKATDPRWTQDYAARQVRPDLTGAQYARWERGEVLPREETLERIAEVFEVSPEYFYTETVNGTPTPTHAVVTLETLDEKLDRALEDLQELRNDLAEREVDAAQDKVQGRGSRSKRRASNS